MLSFLDWSTQGIAEFSLFPCATKWLEMIIFGLKTVWDKLLWFVGTLKIKIKTWFAVGIFFLFEKLRNKLKCPWLGFVLGAISIKTNEYNKLGLIFPDLLHNWEKLCVCV